MRTLEELLEEANTLHRHLCAGQVLGVRMAMAGCGAVGIDEPRDSRDLLVWVEIDRCVSDAIQTVTGCRLGRRTLKFLDYGKTAATFLNVETGDAVRVAALDGARESARKYAVQGTDKRSAQVQAYMKMPVEELLHLRPVRVEVADTDLPGPPARRVTCDACGESVSDGREVVVSGRTLCRPCATLSGHMGPPVRRTRYDDAGTRSKVAPAVVCIVGNSDSGKTRVGCAVTEFLRARGYRVAAIKHCPHGHDTGGTTFDSGRLFEAGADVSVASSPGFQTWVRRSDGDATLERLVADIRGEVDFVVAEGFKSSAYPKVLVFSGTATPGVDNVIAVVGEGAVSAHGKTPVYGFDELDGLAVRLQEGLEAGRDLRPDRAGQGPAGE